MNTFTRFTLTVLLLASGLSGLAAASGKPATPDLLVTKAATREGPPLGKKWKLIWHDEFEGTVVDTNRWMLTSSGPWVYPGFQTRPCETNCALDGHGNLVVRLTQDTDGTVRYHHGLQSRNFQKAYGYFETRVKFSRQPGWWTAVWLSGVPYDEGNDTFVKPQEFDIFEDFYKPKKRTDISHCYHATAGLSVIVDQGNGKGIGGASMLARKEVGRVSKGKVVTLEEYGGWHTVGLQWTPLEHVFYVDGQETLRQSYQEVPVTTVPQRVWISSSLRTPKKTKADGGYMPFYGWLEDATFPDELVVDYVRVYDEDTGDKTAPAITVTLAGNPAELIQGHPATFQIRAEDKDGTVKQVYLFSKGYIRAEANADAAKVSHTFTVTNLFVGDNTIIAMARDNDGLVGISAPLRLSVLTGREYTGTAFQGKPQSIPGNLLAGHYDAGGNGVAFRSDINKGDPRLTWRTNEIAGSIATAIPAGGTHVKWVTYHVNVSESGEYTVELFMNRPDYGRQGHNYTGVPDDIIQLDVDKEKTAEWNLSAAWVTGPGFRQPTKSIGQRRIKLSAGEHQLVVRFDRVETPLTHFGGFGFVRAK